MGLKLAEGERQTQSAEDSREGVVKETDQEEEVDDEPMRIEVRTDVPLVDIPQHGKPKEAQHQGMSENPPVAQSY